MKALTLPPRRVIFEDWFKEGDLGYIFAPRGVGKTWFALDSAKAIATGGAFGPWKSHVCWPVLYVDGEMYFEDDKSRILGLNDGASPENLHVLNHEVLFQRQEIILNLADVSYQLAITELCLDRGIRVLILDNLSCLFSGVSENDPDDWEQVLPWLLRLRRQRIAVVVVHHAGRNLQLRGHSKREDPAAWMVRLDSKDKDGEGARFISRFTKIRGQKLAYDFDWHYQPLGDSQVQVTYKKADQAEVVLQWVRDGLESASDIADEMGITKGTVSKLASKLIDAGKLQRTGRLYALADETF